ncbi:hypothetical protein [Nannocystis pusilla]|uniref:hypothetical protein n=1 Tax=Nannocystis pusilla TaxID=889268 RepID=UPI003B7B67A0
MVDQARLLLGGQRLAGDADLALVVVVARPAQARASEERREREEDDPHAGEMCPQTAAKGNAEDGRSSARGAESRGGPLPRGAAGVHNPAAMPWSREDMAARAARS